MQALSQLSYTPTDCFALRSCETETRILWAIFGVVNPLVHFFANFFWRSVPGREKALWPIRYNAFFGASSRLWGDETGMGVDHYENFPVASVLLPRHLHRPVVAIYRFARAADDFADEGEVPDAVRLANLDGFRRELDLLEAGQSSREPLFIELAEHVRAYHLPIQLFRDLLDAFSQDVVKKRYADFPTLLDYCRRSADPVGRLLLHLFGFTDEARLKMSDAICSSLQLINFWQDVAIDWQKARVYLPQATLAHFGCSEAMLAKGEATPQFIAALRSEVARARAMMDAGAPLGSQLPGRIGLEIRLIVEGGRRILDKIDRQPDVFNHRPVLLARDWPGMFWRALWKQA